MMGKRFGLPRKTQLQLAQGPQWWSHHSVQGLNNQKSNQVGPIILTSPTSGYSSQQSDKTVAYSGSFSVLIKD